MTFGIMTLSRTALTIMGLLATVDKSDIQQNDTQCDNAEY